MASTPSSHNLHDFLVVKELQNTGLESFHLTRIIANDVKFHNGSHFLKLTLINRKEIKEKTYFSVIELKLQVQMNMQALHRPMLLSL